MNADVTCTCLWCRRLPFLDIEQVTPPPKTEARPPRVREVMAPRPLAVEVQVRVEQAHRMMDPDGDRPLAVVAGTQLVGLVTEAELARAARLAGGEAPVDAAMDDDPLEVSPEDRLDRVLDRMVVRGARSALVVDHERVVGVLARTEAERALRA